MNKVPRFKIDWIAVDDISVLWAAAQRGFNAARAKQIEANFDPDLFDPIIVTLPDGDGLHHCIDGQHRVGAVRLWGDGSQRVPCRIIPTNDPVRAADLFWKMNTWRKPPGALDRFKVGVTAGYEVECAVDKIVTSLKYRVEQSSDPGCIRAIDTCVAVFKKDGGEVLRLTLNMLQLIWGMEPAAVDAPVIKGFASFLAHFRSDIDTKRFIERTAKDWTPSRLIGSAKQARELFRGSTSDNIERVLVSTYNKGLRKGHIRLHHRDAETGDVIE